MIAAKLTSVTRSARLTRLVAATLALALMAAGATAEPRYSFDTTPGRLPKTVVPTHYAIELEPNLESLTLAGSELIDIEVREPTAQLVLNAVAMTLGAASIDNDAQSAVIALDAGAETATLTFPRRRSTSSGAGSSPSTIRRTTARNACSRAISSPPTPAAFSRAGTSPPSRRPSRSP